MWIETVILLVILVTAVMLYFYKKGKVDISAMVSVYVFGFILVFTVGLSWLSLLIVFFIMGNVVTRYGYKIKKKYRIEEKVRTFKNVWGNGGASLIFAIVYFLTSNELALIGFLGAVAAATADTFSTEIGQVHSKFPRLITKPTKTVLAGTSGGVSLAGLAASVLGAFSVSVITVFFTADILLVILGTVVGFIGCNIDSLLGATLEADYGWFNKHVVNLTASFSAGFIAILIVILMGL
ncbi:MAG: DUF92 domain-containing protein [Nanoarchaeota archaeon]